VSGTRSAKQLIYGDEISSGAEQRGDGLGQALLTGDQPLHLNKNHGLTGKAGVPSPITQAAGSCKYALTNKQVCKANKSAGSVRNFLESLLVITTSRLRRV